MRGVLVRMREWVLCVKCLVCVKCLCLPYVAGEHLGYLKTLSKA